VIVVQEVPTEASEAVSPDDVTTASWSTIPSRCGGLSSARSTVGESPSAGRRRPVPHSASSSSMKVEKNQAESWRRRRQQWSQQSRHVSSVREDPADHPPPPARLNRSVDFELGGRTAATDDLIASPAPAPAAPVQPPARSFMGRTSSLSCRVLLLDGEEITVQVEVQEGRVFATRCS